MRLAAGLSPGPAGGAITLPRPPSRYKGNGRERKERVGNKEGEEGKERGKREGVRRVGNGKGGSERGREARESGGGIFVQVPPSC